MSADVWSSSPTNFDTPCWQDRVDPDGDLLADDRPVDEAGWGIWDGDGYDRDEQR